MKKLFFLSISLTLLLTAAGCNLPFMGQNQAADPTSADQGVQTPTPEGFGNWQVYESNGVQITLPDTYVLGDVEKDLAKLLTTLESMSERGAAVFRQVMDQLQADIVLWAWNGVSLSDPETGLAIVKTEKFARMPLGVLSRLADTFLGDDAGSFQQDEVTLGGRQVLRFQTSLGIGGTPTTVVMYLFKDSGKLWLVGFLSLQENFDLQNAPFDAAVASFNVLSAE